MFADRVFYHPEQGAGGNTVITWKFDGEEKSYDISDPEQLKEVTKDIELGNLHKKQQAKMAEKLKAVESKAELYEQFENMMQGVREGTVESDRFVQAINAATGLELTVKDKEAIADGTFFDEDSKMIKKLYSEIESLKKDVKQSQADVYWETKRENTHAKLKDKYSGVDGKPVYDPDEVESYCKQEGIFRKDIEKQYETAYLEMNAKAINEAEKQTKTKKEQEQMRKRDAVLSGENAFDFGPGKIKVEGKTYRQLAEEAARIAREQGVSIVTED